MTEEMTQRRPRVLVVVAHPDDAEFMCGGTLAKWGRMGYQLHYALCTPGNHGSHDPDMTAARLADIRQEEQQAAASTFGCRDVQFLGFVDSQLEPTLELRKAITRAIRRTRPHIVICQDPSTFYSGDYINHPDHRAAGAAAMGAIMPSADTPMIFPELLAEDLQPWKPSHVYIGGTTNPNHIEELSEADIESKIRSLREHKSQIADMEAMAKRLRDWAQQTAKEARDSDATFAGEYAERFRLVRLRNLEETMAGEAALAVDTAEQD